MKCEFISVDIEMGTWMGFSTAPSLVLYAELFMIKKLREKKEGKRVNGREGRKEGEKKTRKQKLKLESLICSNTDQ